MKGRNYKFDVEVLTVDKGKDFRIQYGYEFSWKCDEDEEPEIVNEYLKMKLDEKGPQLPALYQPPSMRSHEGGWEVV